MSGGAAPRRRQPGELQRAASPAAVSSPAGSTRTLVGATLATAGVRNTSLNPWLKPEPRPGSEEGRGPAAPRGPREALGGGGSAAAAAAAAAEAGMPFGASIWPHVEVRDPTPVVLQRLCVVATAAFLVFLLPALPTLLVEVGGADGGYDERHGLNLEKACGQDRVTFASAPWPPFEKLLEVTLGLSSLRVERCLLGTAAIFGGLIAADLLGGLAGVQEMWPRSWNCDNARCYTEMFCEPTRPGRLLRRPGNACSNVTYVFSSFCVVCSTLQQPNSGATPNPFWLPDCAFGLMLLVLGSTSVVWHASNAPPPSTRTSGLWTAALST
ncbi:unnamed protein product [Prorocentrum cordatum]|uniref:Rhomboid-like protein n=1 Tax=Prorocentrum cordatum TaxID=2364126 RepID=A0ABN9RDH8_9DINO|nr:unnamed protein product [Polarella glacialis]